MSPVPLPPWWYRAATAGLEPWSAGWGQAGDVSAITARRGRGLPAADSWIHAASAGEATGVPPLVAQWSARHPGERLLITATTPAGRASLARDLPGAAVSSPPVESLAAARRALRAAGVRRLVLLETEIWPAWLAAALESGARVALANGRLSDRAWPAYRRWRGLFAPLVRRLSAVAAQTPLDAERWAALGVPGERVRVTGNTKFDRGPLAAPLPGPGERRAARARLGLDPEGTWCAVGSLRPGEERWLAPLLEGAPPDAPRLLIVPRHPARWADSRRRAGEGGRAVWLLALGVLADAYLAADFAVIGGTLEPYGGHNPVEPAALGRPVILGPSLANCRAAAEALVSAGGAREVGDPDALAAAALEWTRDPAARAASGQAAERGARSLAGAAERTLDWFEACGLWAP